MLMKDQVEMVSFGTNGAADAFSPFAFAIAKGDALGALFFVAVASTSPLSTTSSVATSPATDSEVAEVG